MKLNSTYWKILGVAAMLSLSVSCGSNDKDDDNSDEHVMPTGSSATVTVKSPTSNLNLTEEVDDNAHPEYGDSDRKESLEQIAECATAMGVDKARVKHVGAARTLDVTTEEVLFVKVRDNNTSATLEIKSEVADAKIPAICIFVHGNKAAVTVNQKMNVGKIYYRAKGNKSKTTFTLTSPATLDSADISVTGNKAELAITGLGSTACAALGNAVTGNKTAFLCE